ncbi:MAG TPA: DNA sulfur modification protein DndD [Armatimonadota bacterium]|nr:DNA sulfur modification protein DndD [Armatimonadota bacterium]
MILRRLTLFNFGTYGGEASFELEPIRTGAYPRPVTLIRGKNGVGKTTIMEAIRLCLHGTAGLGRAVSQAEYQDHLARRIHRPRDPDFAPSAASVQLELDYVRAGRPLHYEVKRSWERRDSKVLEALSIREGGATVSENDKEQAELLLRELVPPGAADVFFFDGEKLEMLAREASAGSMLSGTIRAMLGLNVVERLQNDLNAYALNEARRSGTAAADQLSGLMDRAAELEQERERLLTARDANREEIGRLRSLIADREECLAREGHLFALRREDLKATRERLTYQIEGQRRQIQEHCSGLAPFAIAPLVGRRVLERLDKERQYERRETSQKLVRRQRDKLLSLSADPEFWRELGVDLSRSGREHLIRRFSTFLEESVAGERISGASVILNSSEEERHRLHAWITEALGEVPRQFCEAIQRLGQMARELECVEDDLMKAPDEEVLRPRVQELSQLNQELGADLAEEAKMLEDLRRLDFQVDQTNSRLHRVQEEISERDQANARMSVVARTQGLLADYAAELLRIRMLQIERTVVECFNKLCRKDGLLDRARIDPGTFSLTLYRGESAFERAELSAGEQQLLAIALVWATRIVSGVPMPVILDTPIGRLDTEHRLSMVRTYLPEASHQVIVLATDAEIDRRMLDKLEPYLARKYEVRYDPIRGATECTVEHFGAEPVAQMEALTA